MDLHEFKEGQTVTCPKCDSHRVVLLWSDRDDTATYEVWRCSKCGYRFKARRH